MKSNEEKLVIKSLATPIGSYSSMKKICIFAAQYLPHLGGVERYTYNLAVKLIELGNDVTVVTSNTQENREYEIMDGIKVFRVPCISLLAGRYPVLLCNNKLKKIHRILCDKEFDLVIVNTRFYIHSLYGQWFGRNIRAKVITIDHGSSHLSLNNKMLDKLSGIYEHFITKIGQLFCEDYYGVSQASAKWLGHFHIKAKGVMYNSINLDEVREMLSVCQKKYRDKYNIGDTDIVVTFTGRLLPEKGVPQLISAMREINKSNKNVYLFLAGEGPLDEYVNNNRTRHVKQLGVLPYEEVITLLSETDIFCLPSFSEGFSTSILEAIACKCFVVTTERGGAKETFPTNDFGMVIKNNDTQLLVDALLEAINNKEMRDEAAELAYNRLEKNYTWDIVAKKVESIIEEKNECKINY